MAQWFKIFGVAILSFLCSFPATATHIRGGVITVHKIGNLQFEFTFIGYRDRGSTIPIGGGDFDFGDGNSIENVGQQVSVAVHPINDEIDSVIFKVVHNYQEAGVYTASYSEEFRNADIMNMSNSVVTAFYVETSFYTEVDNSTPLPPAGVFDPFQVGKAELRNFQFTDTDHDIIRYVLTVPRQGKTQYVNSYRYPDNPEFYSNYPFGNSAGDDIPIFSVDRRTGTLYWDTPGDAIINGYREYALALMVNEYRVVNGTQRKISSTTLDLQLIVDEASDEYLNVSIGEATFCKGNDSPLNFEVRSNLPYAIAIEPETAVFTINGVVAGEVSDSTFTSDSQFEILFNDFEEEQFVSFTITSAGEERIGSSFTYALSENCDQYVLGSGWSSTGKPVLYPNPAAENLWIQTSGEPFNYVIFGLDGKKLMQGSLNSSGKIDLIALKNGIYLIQLFSLNSKNRTVERFIVKR